MTENNVSQDLLIKAYDFWRIGNAAVKEAQEKNRRMGIPNVYSINGKIYHENQDGDLIKGSPFDDL